MPPPTDSMRELDPYELLQVRRDASLTEIRRAYRRQVLEAHPDKNPHRSEWSERRIRELLRAFEILGNADRRNEYDRQWRLTHGRGTGGAGEGHLFFFRKSDPECLALRVLYFLVRLRGDEALALLVESEDRHGADFLRRELDRADYLDCLFLLGEHLIKKRRYTEALDRLLVLYRIDAPARFRRHYFDLAVEHLKSLYLRFLPKALSPGELVERIEEGLATVSWTPKECARLHLILAKSHRKLGDLATAVESLDRALEADPGFARAKRWRAELVAAGVLS